MKRKFNKKFFNYLINIIMLVSIIASVFMPILAHMFSPKDISNQVLQMGINAYQLGYYQEALIQFEDAIAYNPLNYQAFAYRAAVYLALENFEKANEDIKIAEAHLPLDVFLLNIKAQILQNNLDSLGVEEEKELEVLLKELIVLEPENHDFLLWRGSYYYSKGEYDKAILDLKPLFSNANALLYLGTSYFELGDYEKAVDSLKKANDLSENNPQILQQLAIAYFNLGQYNLAIEFQAMLINVVPESSTLYKDFGLMQLMINNHQDALESYLKAKSLTPNDKEISFQLGILYFQLKQQEQAIKFFSEAIETDDKWVDAYLNRATSLLALERYTEAYEDYQMAYSILPNSLEIRNQMAEINLLLGNIETAINDYAFLIENDPENIEYLFSHAFLVTTYQSENCENVLWELEKIMEIDSSQQLPYHYIGLCSYTMGDFSDAYKNWEKAFSALPDNIDSLYFMALVDYENDNYNRALININLLISIDSSHGMAHYLQGNIFLELEEYEEAIKSYTLAIEMKTNILISRFNRGVAYYNLNLLNEAETDFLIAKDYASSDENAQLVENIEAALTTLYNHPNWAKIQ